MKPKKYSAKKEIKSIARERIGSPKPGRTIETKEERRKPKHKKRVFLEE
jgi:hypothetical protein